MAAPTLSGIAQMLHADMLRMMLNDKRGGEKIMPFHIGTVVEPSYQICYQKKKDTICVGAPDKEDAKELFEWLADKTGFIPAP